MSKPTSSFRAIAFGVMAAFFVSVILSAIGPLIEYAMLKWARDESVSISEYVETLYWPMMTYTLSGTVLLFAIGGYVASRNAPKRFLAHAVASALIVFSLGSLAIYYSGEFEAEFIAIVGFVGIASSIGGGFVAAKARSRACAF